MKCDWHPLKCNKYNNLKLSATPVGTGCARAQGGLTGVRAGCARAQGGLTGVGVDRARAQGGLTGVRVGSDGSVWLFAIPKHWFGAGGGCLTGVGVDRARAQGWLTGVRAGVDGSVWMFAMPNIVCATGFLGNTLDRELGLHFQLVPKHNL